MPNIDPKDIPNLVYGWFMDKMNSGKNEKEMEWVCRKCTVVYEDDEAKDNKFQCRLCGESLVKE